MTTEQKLGYGYYEEADGEYVVIPFHKVELLRVMREIMGHRKAGFRLHFLSKCSEGESENSLHSDIVAETLDGLKERLYRENASSDFMAAVKKTAQNCQHLGYAPKQG